MHFKSILQNFCCFRFLFDSIRYVLCLWSWVAAVADFGFGFFFGCQSSVSSAQSSGCSVFQFVSSFGLGFCLFSARALIFICFCRRHAGSLLKDKVRPSALLLTSNTENTRATKKFRFRFWFWFWYWVSKYSYAYENIVIDSLEYRKLKATLPEGLGNPRNFDAFDPDRAPDFHRK